MWPIDLPAPWHPDRIGVSSTNPPPGQGGSLQDRSDTVMGLRNCATLLGLSAIFATSADAADGRIAWRKTTIDKKFRSAGVGTADVNRDGRFDVLIGDSWYEAPSWAKHDI